MIGFRHRYVRDLGNWADEGSLRIESNRKHGNGGPKEYKLSVEVRVEQDSKRVWETIMRHVISGTPDEQTAQKGGRGASRGRRKAKKPSQGVMDKIGDGIAKVFDIAAKVCACRTKAENTTHSKRSAARIP